MRKNIAAGNWKMNLTYAEAQGLVKEILEGIRTFPLQGNEVILSTPALYLKPMADLVKDVPGVHIAAQNVHHEEKGAYTGEISAAMLASIGVGVCLVGHSERREYFGEDNALLATKVSRLLALGIKPVYCLGEKLEQREAGNTLEVIQTQMKEGVFGLAESEFAQLVIAYEPVWAIGTGKTASPEQAQEVHKFIRKLIEDQYNAETAENTTILYGGSVKPANAEGLFAKPDIDGGLVGGASLKAPDFIAIIQAL